MTFKKYFSPQLLLLLVVLLSLGLRVYHLGLQSYWIDEMVSLYFTTRNFWRDIFLDNHPFLYHLLLKLWIKGFGVSEFATRFLSVIFSVITTVGMYFTALLVIKQKRWALMAAFFYAISAFSIVYAQETRMYALFELASLLNLFFFYEVYFEKKREAWAGFLVSCILLGLCHYGALIVFVFEAGLLVLQKDKGKRFFLVGLGAGVLIVCLSYFYQFSWLALDWQRFKYQTEPTSRTPIEGLVYLSNLSLFNLVFYVAFFGFAYQQIRKFKDKSRIFLWLAGFIAFGLFALQLATTVTSRALMLPRYFIFLNPAWILLFVYSASVYKRKTLWIWIGVISVIAVLWLPKAYFDVKAPWRRAFAKIVADPDRSVVVTTRTLTIAVPYLEAYGIPVVKLTSPDISNVSLFMRHFKEGKAVWIVENYGGGRFYLAGYVRDLKAAKLHVEEFTFQNEFSEPLSLVRVSQ